MHAYTTAGWESLFVAEAGASAALAGLLFVAVSINLAKVLEHPTAQPGRGGDRAAGRRPGRLDARVGACGLYWLVPGVVLCLVVAVFDAWVLLIEILR
ncbi:MAG TPA: hypothetical protein VFU54_05320 [Actinomycetota bacterium]|nr:hypothetical protein [Actinomycetota bacterium]